MEQQYITREGFNRLKAEWEDLKYRQRPEMQKQVAIAAAEGDRSENASYTYGKMKLRDIDRRLRQLDQMIDRCSIVEHTPENQQEIFFGAKVTLADANGKESLYYLVGPAEVDALQGRISLNSPLGKALLHKKTGETVMVSTPRGEMNFTIKEIRYE